MKDKLKIYENLKSEENISIAAPKTNDFQCGNCGDKLHQMRNCPHKDKGPKCFVYNEFGHLSTSHTAKTPRINIISTVDSTEYDSRGEIDAAILNHKKKYGKDD